MTALSLALPADGHQAVPVEGSWYCERSTWPANLKAVASYPVVALCGQCHGRIRLASPGQAEWSHVPTGPEARVAESA